MIKHNSKFEYNQRQSFGFRKLSIGLAAVTLSTIFFITTSQTAHADEIQNSTQMQVETDKNNEQQSQLENNDQNVQVENDQKQDSSTQAAAELDATKQNDQSQVSNNHNDSTAAQKDSTSTSNKDNIITGQIDTKTIDGKELTNQNQLQAGYNNVEIDTSINGNRVTTPQNSNISINIGNAGEADGNQAWIVQGFAKGSSKTVTVNENGKDVDRYQITYNGDGNFNVAVLGNLADAENMEFNYKFYVVGNKNYLNDDLSKSASLPVTIKFNNNVVASKDVTTNIVKAEETVVSNELAHIWARGLVDSETEYTQFIPADQKNDAKILQYMIDWNLGDLINLKDVDYSEIFSVGQKLLPDTIKVFRVYEGVLKNDNISERLPWSNDTYNQITGKFDSTTGLFSNEDTAFEEFLRNSLYVTINGADQPISYSDFVKEYNNGNLPTISKIHFHVDGPFKYTASNGQVYDWSKNGGQDGENTSDTAITNPHSTFFIQMDTLLAHNMPSDWVTPGEGPSSEINTTMPNVVVSGSGENGKATFIGFNNGGSGYFNESAHTAELYFADVSDKDKVVNLGGTNNIPAFLSGSNQLTATVSTPITFANVQDIISSLKKLGYNFVGASIGQHTDGTYDGSTLYQNDTYDDSKYGNYDWITKAFTLNFKKINKPVQPTDPQPTQPTTPVNPTEPVQPTTPVTPTEPVQPTTDESITPLSETIQPHSSKGDANISNKHAKKSSGTILTNKNNKHNSNNLNKKSSKKTSGKLITTSTVTNTANDKNTDQNSTNKTTLPETGTHDSSIFGIIGMFLLAIAAFFGINLGKKKRD